MIAWKFKLWRTAGVAAAMSLAAACGDGGAGDAHDADGGASAPATPAPEAVAPAAASGGEGGESGEAGAASAYAGVSGDQLTALRLHHLRGFILIARAVAQEDHPADAGILVQQGLLEVYDAAPDQFGTMNIELIRAATDVSLNKAQMVSRLRAAEAELQRADDGLEVDYAALTARLVDIATGLYQSVNRGDHIDPIEYQHSLGAAMAARAAVIDGASVLRRENLGAFSEAQGELNRFVSLWPDPTPGQTAAPYAQVLAQGSRVRLALSPFL